jgi:hypothetical protein
MSRRQKDPLRALTDEERAELSRLSRSRRAAEQIAMRSGHQHPQQHAHRDGRPGRLRLAIRREPRGERARRIGAELDRKADTGPAQYAVKVGTQEVDLGNELAVTEPFGTAAMRVGAEHRRARASKAVPTQAVKMGGSEGPSPRRGGGKGRYQPCSSKPRSSLRTRFSCSSTWPVIS